MQAIVCIKQVLDTTEVKTKVPGMLPALFMTTPQACSWPFDYVPTPRIAA